MHNFVYVIGSKDDFSDARELCSAYFSGEIKDKNASVYEFQVNETCAIAGYSLTEMATLVGQGMAFESWTQTDAFGLLIEL